MRKSIFFYVFILFLCSACGKTYRNFNKAISNPAEVKKLNLSHQKLGRLSPNIALLYNLEELTLFSCNLYELPPQIGQLPKLKKLILSKNHLKTLPPEIANLTQLEDISLAYNDFEETPAVLGELDSLRRLVLSNNNIGLFSPNLLNLKKLKYLHLQQNELYNLPENINELESLRRVYLGRNNLITLPESFFTIPGLIEVDLVYAGMGLFIPETFCEAENLEYFYIDPKSVVPGCVVVPANRQLKVYVREKTFMQ